MEKETSQSKMVNTIKFKPGMAWLAVTELINALDNPENIAQLEKKNAGLWILTTKDTETYSRIIKEGINVKGEHVRCYDVMSVVKPTKQVTFKNVPYQAQDQILTDHLSAFGEVISLERCCYENTNICNGTVIAEMRITSNIPRMIELAANIHILCEYAGQRELASVVDHQPIFQTDAQILYVTFVNREAIGVQIVNVQKLAINVERRDTYKEAVDKERPLLRLLVRHTQSPRKTPMQIL